MADTRPNLVFVFPDQMRGSAMGFLNKEPVKTPRIDQFAKESLVLTEAVSNYPVCSPYRAMFMSGKYPYANGVLGNCHSANSPLGVELNENDSCWSDILKADGYHLGYVGKWHLDAPNEPYVRCLNNQGDIKWNEWCPPHRRHGFDYWHSYGTYDYHMNPMYWDTHAGREGFHFVDQWGPEYETDRAIDYIRNEQGRFRNKDKPFALVVSMNPPHTPYEAVPESYREIYEDTHTESLCKMPNIPPAGTEWGDYYRENIRNYYSQITGVDEQFGRIIDTLEAEGLSKNTLVVFTSDHGDCIGMHNVPHKPHGYEAAMQVPFIVRWPGKIKPGSNNVLLSTPDIYPTLLELLGVQPSALPEDIEGVSHAQNLLEKSNSGPTSQVFVTLDPRGIGWERWGVRTKRYSYFYEKRGDTVRHYLFDRETDPHQLQNRYNESSKLVRSLEDELAKWQEIKGLNKRAFADILA